MIAVFLLFLSAGSADKELRVTDDNAFVFEAPDAESPALRRLFVGELVRVRDSVLGTDGAPWVEVVLGVEAVGYMRATKLGKASEQPKKSWRKQENPRRRRPVAVGARALAETFGGAVLLRYQPFSRIGASFAMGTVVTPRFRLAGVALSGGVVGYLVDWNLSPVVEFGFARSTHHGRHSNLAMTTMYGSAGVEWMFDFGLFVALTATYSYAISVEIVFDYQTAQSGAFAVEEYGRADKGQKPPFQYLEPGLAIGYAF